MVETKGHYEKVKDELTTLVKDGEDGFKRHEEDVTDPAVIRREINKMTGFMLLAAFFHPMYMLFDSAAIAANGA